ncbi:hypothetical protein ATANTOWER_020414 [Ataeniobius toweri]|uniref:Fibronectin type-III domain-containing protein n=1 Tax=Ataeniobius toweri TaxID=208326 RepID=A0ABU7A810_9TELE|nr:hypothetical protein [Ataeniobius toweri]
MSTHGLCNVLRSHLPYLAVSLYIRRLWGIVPAEYAWCRWSRPSQINGVLKFYSIFLSHDGSEPMLAYNSSDLAEEHTLRNLTPGTSYSVTVAACTGGGCTRSPPSHVQTEESTPENVPEPLVIPLSPHSLNISWAPPETPNGLNGSRSERTEFHQDTLSG